MKVMEFGLRSPDRCVVECKANDTGEDSYQNLVHWLRRRQGSEAQRDRAEYPLQRCERLRHQTCLNPRTFLMCCRYSPARRSSAIRWINKKTSAEVQEGSATNVQSRSLN